MRLTTTDLAFFQGSSKCDRRVFLRSRGASEEPPSAYDEVLFRLGERHERKHLASLTPVVDLSEVPIDERFARTNKAIGERMPVVYQGAFHSRAVLSGQSCEIVGVPDFLVLEGDGYLIRDSKMARRITETDHPEIMRQLGLYGWLYECCTGDRPAALQVFNGPGEFVGIPYDDGKGALSDLERIVSIVQSTSEPYAPVGWTKCGGCCFRHLCLAEAKEKRDVALVDGVDQGLAAALHGIGIATIDEFLDRFTESALADFQRPWGNTTRRVGKSAAAIMVMAQAMANGSEIILTKPSLPDSPNYVMFDLEGLPPQLDELDKIYLWGTQVFGDSPGEFLPSVASFGPKGDEYGWRLFLNNSKQILDEYGDIPFVHWHHYERTKLDTYVKRYGDPDGIAARVHSNLLDLLPITRQSIALPLPSYSLKVVEKYIGFKRTLDEYGGDWAMAQYIEAVETEDESKRKAIMDKILTYNKEDLEATWAVLLWLKKKAQEAS